MRSYPKVSVPDIVTSFLVGVFDFHGSTCGRMEQTSMNYIFCLHLPEFDGKYRKARSQVDLHSWQSDGSCNWDKLLEGVKI